MPYTNDGKNAMLNHLKTLMTHIALHDAQGNEISGGTPAYARKSATWGTASGGELSLSGEVEFNVPGGKTVKYVSFKSALTSGVEYARGTVTEETYGNQGSFVVKGATLDLNG